MVTTSTAGVETASESCDHCSAVELYVSNMDMNVNMNVNMNMNVDMAVNMNIKI